MYVPQLISAVNQIEGIENSLSSKLALQIDTDPIPSI